MRLGAAIWAVAHFEHDNNISTLLIMLGEKHLSWSGLFWALKLSGYRKFSFYTESVLPWVIKWNDCSVKMIVLTATLSETFDIFKQNKTKQKLCKWIIMILKLFQLGLLWGNLLKWDSCFLNYMLVVCYKESATKIMKMAAKVPAKLILLTGPPGIMQVAACVVRNRRFTESYSFFLQYVWK